jgi:hypothetical protein
VLKGYFSIHSFLMKKNSISQFEPLLFLQEAAYKFDLIIISKK